MRRTRFDTCSYSIVFLPRSIAHGAAIFAATTKAYHNNALMPFRVIESQPSSVVIRLLDLKAGILNAYVLIPQGALIPYRGTLKA